MSEGPEDTAARVALWPALHLGADARPRRNAEELLVATT